jgi:hypothetical protein
MSERAVIPNEVRDLTTEMVHLKKPVYRKLRVRGPSLRSG